jgi:acetyl esterase/lipase
MLQEWTEQVLDEGRFAPLRLRIHRNPTGNKATPVVFHLHGGAFVEGSFDTGSTVANLLAEAGATVVAAQYPKAPANPFPSALNAAYDMLMWAYKNCPHGKGCKAYVAGEEAGGNLAAALALMARDQHMPPLAGQILLSPMLDPCLATKSVRAAEAGPVGCKWADGWHSYLGSADKASHPYASPLGASRLAGLPPALVITAEDDPMHDESLKYAARLRECGVFVQEHVLAGPTGWPDALQHPPADPACAQRLRGLFAEFFETTANMSNPASANRL